MENGDTVTWPTVPDQNSWGYGKAFSKAKLVERQSELLPGNRLTIVCNLEIYYCDKQTDGKGPSADAPSTNDFKEQVKNITFLYHATSAGFFCAFWGKLDFYQKA